MKPYLLDGKCADMTDLIAAAKELDPKFGSAGFFTTSLAAKILRGHGHTVSENKKHQELENAR